MANSFIATNKFLRIFAIWWVIWISIQVMVLQYFGFDFKIALTDSLVFNLLLAASCIFIGYVMQFYLPQKEKYWYIIAVSTISALVVTFFSNFILSHLFTGETAYHDFTGTAWPVRASIAFLLSACMAFVSIIYYTVEEQKDSEKRKHDAEQFAKEAELFNLRQQLQPHFLFNSLNSISALAGSRPEEARKMIQQLSDFLRGTVKKDEGQFNTVDEELKHLQLYLEIEKVRFGHRLETEISCAEEIKQLKIPALLLQPIVENAIKFGLYDTLEPVTIRITAKSENNMLVISVINPFDQASIRQSGQKGTGFGLNSIQRRLYLLFSRNDLLHTTTNDNIFTTTIKIPQL